MNIIQLFRIHVFVELNAPTHRLIFCKNLPAPHFTYLYKHTVFVLVINWIVKSITPKHKGLVQCELMYLYDVGS